MNQSSKNTFKKILQHSAVKFLSVGMINTLLSIIVIFSLKFFFNANDIFANAVGYIAGLACSYILNKNWTFKHSYSTWSTLFKFLITFAISYAVNILTVLTFIKLGVNDYFSQLTGIPLYSIVFYLGSRYFVFNNKKLEDASN